LFASNGFCSFIWQIDFWSLFLLNLFLFDTFYDISYLSVLLLVELVITNSWVGYLVSWVSTYNYQLRIMRINPLFFSISFCLFFVGTWSFVSLLSWSLIPLIFGICYEQIWAVIVTWFQYGFICDHPKTVYGRDVFGSSVTQHHMIPWHHI
jgi:signal transduction histidine kinase